MSVTRWRLRRGFTLVELLVVLAIIGILIALLLPGSPGDVAAFVWTGVFPGLALSRLLLPGSAPTTRWTLGIVLAPVASTVAAYWLLHAGLPLATAARIVGMGGWLVRPMQQRWEGWLAKAADERMKFEPGEKPDSPKMVKAIEAELEKK